MRKCPDQIRITLREKAVDIEKTGFSFNFRKTRRQFASEESSRNGVEGIILLVPILRTFCKIEEINNAITAGWGDIY